MPEPESENHAGEIIVGPENGIQGHLAVWSWGVFVATSKLNLAAYEKHRAWPVLRSLGLKSRELRALTHWQLILLLAA